MRIGFDFRPAIKKNSRRRGIGKYTYHLIKNLLEVNREHSYVLYTRGRHNPRLHDDYEKKDLPYLSRPSRLNWIPDLFFLPRRLRLDNIDIFHATEITAIPRRSQAQVWVNVHDLIPFIFWNEIRQAIPRDYAYVLRRSVEKIVSADLIITDSWHSKRDICERLGVMEHLVRVVYPGCDARFAPIPPDISRSWLKEKYSLGDPFVFYVGGSDFRKNLKRLLRAFHQIRKKGYSGKLVLGGETFLWNIPEIRQIRRQIEQLGLHSSVRFPGYIPDEDLPLFYSACDLFIFPSLYEGFGLPVLEAMKCGAPVLASRTSSIPEVGGDATVYMDPEDGESIVAGFEKIYGNKEKIAELRQKGLQQADRFSWRKTAQQIYGLYKANN